MPTIEYDLGYLQAGLDLLETYLISKSLFFAIGAQSPSGDWASILQFSLSLLATIVFGGLASMMLLAGFIQQINLTTQFQAINSFMFVPFAWISA